MPDIYPDETPIYTQLRQERTARGLYTEMFGTEVTVTPLNDAGAPSGETFKVRGGSVTVYGDPRVTR